MKIALSICVALLVSNTAAAAPPPTERTVERVVAFVDGRPIWLSDLRRAAVSLRSQLQQLPKDKRAGARKEIFAQLLTREIERALVAKEAAVVKMSVSPREVDRAVAAVAKQNGISTKELFTAVAKEGLSQKAYRSELRHQLLEAKLLKLHVARRKIDATGPKGLKRLEAERKRWVDGLRKKSRITIRVRP